MKRTLATAAAVGLLGLGLAGCGGEEEEPADPPAPVAPTEDDEATESPDEGSDSTGSPGDDGATTAPGVPGDGETTTAPPGAGGEIDPEIAEFCAEAQAVVTGGGTGEEQLQAFEDLRDIAPEEPAADLDAILGELEGLSGEELDAATPPPGVDVEVLEEAALGFGEYVGTNCVGGDTGVAPPAPSPSP